ncbi:MAG: hypothetical protein ACKOXK_05680 [Chakrabartia sp.]
MTKPVCFLFNHEDVHQIAHSLPVARALAQAHPALDIEIAVSTAAQRNAVSALLGDDAARLGLRVVELGLSPWMEGITSALSRIVPARRVAILSRHLAYLKGFDALVVPEFTSTLLRSRWQLTRPALICIPHGSGDRSVGFSDELRLFDLILVAGEKTRGRMLDRHPMLASRIKVCGYPKFDTLDLTRKPKLFNNDRPTVVYNPHFDPKLSSWYRFGPDVLRFFAEQDRYNLVFAPHVMLFRKLIHGSLEHRELKWRGSVPDRYRHLDHMMIDPGSTRSVDMTYTLAGDIYLGDVSSQIYEWIMRPRPAIFLKSHPVDWQHDANYGHWALGPVLDNVAALPATLDALTADATPYLAAQRAAAEATVATGPGTASARCAHAIATFIGAADQAALPDSD